MAERPPRDGSGDRDPGGAPEVGTPEDNWLYGKRGNAGSCRMQRPPQRRDAHGRPTACSSP